MSDIEIRMMQWGKKVLPQPNPYGSKRRVGLLVFVFLICVSFRIGSFSIYRVFIDFFNTVILLFAFRIPYFSVLLSAQISLYFQYFMMLLSRLITPNTEDVSL